MTADATCAAFATALNAVSTAAAHGTWNAEVADSSSGFTCTLTAISEVFFASGSGFDVAFS